MSAPAGPGAFVLRRCAEVMRAWLAATRRAQMRGYALVATSQGLFALGTAVAFALSAMLYRDGTLTIGTVYLIFQYTEMLRQPTEQIRNEVQDLQQADASMGRIEALLGTATAHSSMAPAMRCRPARWRWSWTASRSATRRTCRSCATSACAWNRAGCWVWWGAPAAARRR